MIKQRGFTLIEMAIVMVIVGLLVGGGLFAIGPITIRAKFNTTNANLDQIESALTLFAIRNNRLPCPADGHLTTGSTNYGLEVTQTSAGTSADTCNMAAYGGSGNAYAVIPWRTLGLDENYSVDGWNNRISYFPANPQLTGIATLVDSTTSPASNCLNRISSTTTPPQGFRSATVCDPSSTGLTGGNYGTYVVPTYPFNSYIPVYTAKVSPGASDELTSANPASITSSTVGTAGLRAAYVLISHGVSGWYGWTRVGTQYTPPGTRTVKAYNNDGSANGVGFVQGTPQPISEEGSTSYFDDIVRWRSPGMIIQNCGSGACGNP